MPKAEIRVFKDLEHLSHGAAEEFAGLAAQTPSGPFAAALSGGSTPKPFYELLAAPEFSGRIPWPAVHLFQVDERCVAPDDARSNFRMMREAMLDRIPGIHFHRMAAEQADREAAAKSYETELRATLETAPGAWPGFDVIYLGMGDDGHTASLFPGTGALEERRLAVCANYVPKFDMFRLTLTLPVLNAGARVIFLVAGSKKAERLRDVLSAPSTNPPKYPAQLVQPMDGTVAWYLDEAAARLL